MLLYEKGSTTFVILQTIGSLSSIVALYLASTNSEKTNTLILLLAIATLVAIATNIERFIKQRFPRCLQHLDVFAVDRDAYGETVINGNNAHSLFIVVKNYEPTNVRVSEVIFRPYLWKSTFTKEKTQIAISPYAQRIGKEEKYPLKFGQPALSDPATAVVIPMGPLSSGYGFVSGYGNVPISGYFISSSSSFGNMDYIDDSVIGKSLVFDLTDIMLGPQQHSIALLPLSNPPEGNLITSKQCGIVDLRYKTDDGRSGLHRVSV